MKKKILATIMMTVLALGVTACGGGVVGVVQDLEKKENEKQQATEVEDVEIDLEDAVNDAIEEQEQDTDVVVEDTSDDTAEDMGLFTDEVGSEGTLTFTVPEGFTYLEDSQLYNSPDSLGNIIYQTMENNGSFAFITQSLMETGLESSLGTQFGMTIDITFLSWENITVEGYDAIRYSISYEVSGIPVVQTQIVISGTDNLHYLTFTEMNNSGYQDDFAACEASMKFEK